MKKSILTACISLLAAICLYAQEDQDAAALAKKLANPIASLISVPFQNNTDYGIGDLKGTRNTLNFQPVIPIALNDNLNLITRMVLPIVSQYNITEAGAGQKGLSDAVVSAFFSPVNGSNITWGAGPVFLVPTGSDDFLTTDKFGVGPTAVGLYQKNGWTFGGLINQIWSIAGSNDHSDVSQLFFQPFVVYNWKSGAGVGANVEWTQNWVTDTGTVWLNPTVSAVSALGKQKIQVVVGPRLNLGAPDGTQADLGWRAVLIFLFPK